MKYANLSDRVKAFFFDQLFMIFLAILASRFLGEEGNVPDSYRIVAFILIVFIYEPFCTSVLGFTLGHYLMRIRVRRRSDETRKINILAAIFRYVLKICLGWISLLTISSSKRKTAIHDIVAGSVVLKSKQSLTEEEELNDPIHLLVDDKEDV
ncbi:MAG: RDD family protein [Bacteroidetes bacterium]|nr:RDD family protein [Bacteroidota bacterium]